MISLTFAFIVLKYIQFRENPYRKSYKTYHAKVSSKQDEVLHQSLKKFCAKMEPAKGVGRKTMKSFLLSSTVPLSTMKHIDILRACLSDFVYKHRKVGKIISAILHILHFLAIFRQCTSFYLLCRELLLIWRFRRSQK